MSQVDVIIRCRCERTTGQQCDPCIQRAFEALHEQCASDPECQDTDKVTDDGGNIFALEAPQATGREGYRCSASKPDSKEEPPAESWKSISERLAKLDKDDAALDKLAAKLLEG